MLPPDDPMPELMVLLERPGERTAWLRAAQRVGVLALVAQDPAELLTQLVAEPPDAVVLPLGHREEEALLLVRAIRRRRVGQWLPIYFIDRGAHLVLSPEDAERVGADALLSGRTPDEALAQVRAALRASAPSTLPPDLGGAAQPDAGASGHSALIPIEIDDAGWPMTPAPTRPAPGAPLAPRAPAPTARRWVPSWQADLEALAQKLLEVHEGDCFALLEVSPEDDDAALEAALTRLLSRFDPRALPEPITRQHAAELEALREALIDAWHVLADPTLRRRYREALYGL